MPADQGRVRGLVPAPPGRHHPGLPAPGRLLLPDAPRLPGRARAGAWGITTGGKPAFLGLAPGSGESADAWHDFLTDLKDRGLPSPLLVISDGAPGLVAAIEQAFPKALRQRCLVHRARNVLAKVPAGMQAEIKDAYWKLFGTEDLTTRPGPKLVELVDHRITEMADRYSAIYPAAMKCLLADREGLTAYLRFPAEHHHRIRHSNFIERTFGETRRRTKVIGRLPGEISCLTLVWAVLDPRLPRLARPDHDQRRPPAAAGPAPFPARPAPPAPATHRHQRRRSQAAECQCHRLTSP
jgi:putative transposase